MEKMPFTGAPGDEGLSIPRVQDAEFIVVVLPFRAHRTRRPQSSGVHAGRSADGRAMLQVQCAMFAYQGKTAIAWVESGQQDQPLHGRRNHPLLLFDITPFAQTGPPSVMSTPPMRR